MCRAFYLTNFFYLQLASFSMYPKPSTKYLARANEIEKKDILSAYFRKKLHFHIDLHVVRLYAIKVGLAYQQRTHGQTKSLLELIEKLEQAPHTRPFHMHLFLSLEYKLS